MMDVSPAALEASSPPLPEAPVAIDGLFGWFTPGTSRRGVVLCGTLGYEQLSAELAEIQRLGYAVDRQEHNLNVWCVAAPILGVRQTQPAAVSVSACRPRLDRDEEERLGKLVIAAATRIADRLGGLGHMPTW